MKLQAILSSVALVAAMSFSGAAVAQMSFELAVPGEQEEAVKAACAALTAQGTASLTTESDESTDAMATGSTGTESGQSTSGDPASKDYWDVVIAGLTLENCKAMGL
jgi:hypothetical protein